MEENTKETITPKTHFLETKGNIWEYFYSNEAAVVIPTNGSRDKFGYNVMDSGLALDAKELFPNLPMLIGRSIKKMKGHNGVFVFSFPTDKVNEVEKKKEYNFVFTFPTKYNYWDNVADFKRIELSTFQLVKALNQLEKRLGIEKVVVPRVGCGSGNLNWKEVQPILFNLLDERFIVIEKDIEEDTYGIE